MYLRWLDEMTDTEPSHHLITTPDQQPPLWAMAYRDIPEPGSLTGFTYGLSSAEHPDWKLGYPELMISLDSNDIEWVLAVGYLAKAYRGISPFSYGTIHRFGEQVSAESEMKAFVVFAPSLLAQADAHIELPDRTINLVQMYPIYESEIEMIKFEGVGKFFDKVGDVHDPKRKPVVWESE